MVEKPSIVNTRKVAAGMAGDTSLENAPMNDDKINRALLEANIARIVNDPSYLPADQDLGLLEDDASRGLRLELEYLKADLHLARRGIDHTIVVFGSTRIEDPSISAGKLAAVKRERDRNPDDPQIQRQLQIAERAHDNSRYYEIAVEFGRLVGRAPSGDKRSRLFVMSGGGPGIMEAVHRGAYEVGADSVGLNIMLPFEQLPNPFLTPGLCFNFRYFALRKLHFMHRARALVVFPGGFGTLDELFETLTLVSTKKIAPLPVILVGETYWKRAIDIDFLISEGTLTEAESKLFWYCETAAEIWKGILSWYEDQGQGLFNIRAE
jgi:uncharacterized protein (TIGR00730 family)